MTSTSCRTSTGLSSVMTSTSRQESTSTTFRNKASLLEIYNCGSHSVRRTSSNLKVFDLQSLDIILKQSLHPRNNTQTQPPPPPKVQSSTHTSCTSGSTTFSRQTLPSTSLVKWAVFLVRLKSWGWGPFPPFQCVSRTLRLLNTLNNEVGGSKVFFPWRFLADHQKITSKGPKC